RILMARGLNSGSSLVRKRIRTFVSIPIMAENPCADSLPNGPVHFLDGNCFLRLGQNTVRVLNPAPDRKEDQASVIIDQKPHFISGMQLQLLTDMGRYRQLPLGGYCGCFKHDLPPLFLHYLIM